MPKKEPNLLPFAILTLFTILVWIVAEVYQILHKTNLENIPAGVLAPLNPTLDKNTLDNIQSRKFFSDEQIPSRNRPLVTPTPSEAESSNSAKPIGP